MSAGVSYARDRVVHAVNQLSISVVASPLLATVTEPTDFIVVLSASLCVRAACLLLEMNRVTS